MLEQGFVLIEPEFDLKIAASLNYLKVFVTA